jgi:hypothetical protein
MIQITTTLAGFPLKEAKKIEVNIYFPLGSETSRAYWAMWSDDNEKLAQGDLLIPQEIHMNWGTDDSIVEDYVLQQLGLQKEMPA